MDIKLIFVFETDENREEKFELRDVKENLTDQDILNYGESIVQNDYLAPKEGKKYTSLVGISKITTTVENIF